MYRVLGQQHGDATTAGVAGWTTTKTPDTNLSDAGGAYGMFIFPSASFISQDVTGSLAAIWYFEDGAIALTGSDLGLTANGLGAGIPILSEDGNFTAQVLVGDGSVTKGTPVHELPAASLSDKIKFNFNRDSKDFIRRVFSTDPTRTNSAITYTAGNSYSTKKYWLGETYESATAVGGDSQMFVENTAKTGSSDKMFGVILQLNDSDAAGIKWHNHNKDAQAAATGWFISQDTRGNTNANFNPVVHTEKLFKIHALGGAKSAGGTDPGTGESGNREIKVSLTDIKVSPNNFNDYATFSLLVRDAKDTDNNPIILERFSSLTLDPSSANYISKVIGDRSYRYDENEKVVDFLGAYANLSLIHI